MSIACRLVLAFVSLASLAPAAAQADESAYSAQYKKCVQASNANTFAMIECSTKETAAWDKALNANYKKLMAKLSPAQQKALTAAEQAWIKFRDANCAFAADPDGGQMARLSASDCVLRMTADRAAELADFAN